MEQVKQVALDDLNTVDEVGRSLWHNISPRKQPLDHPTVRPSAWHDLDLWR